MKTNKSVDAWNKFCESLKDTGQILLEEKTPQDETTQADGLRYLVHMIRAGFENTYEFSDVTRPVLVPMVSPTLLYEGAGSAARYLQGYIDGGKSYRVYGKRGTAPLLELSLYNGKIGIHEPCHLVAALTEEDIVLEDDGRLEVTIGPEPKPGNHLLSNTDTCFMMIRQYTHVWDETIEGEFFIECLDEQAMQLPSTVSEVSDGLEQTAQFVSTVAQYWSALSDYWIGLLPVPARFHQGSGIARRSDKLTHQVPYIHGNRNSHQSFPDGRLAINHQSVHTVGVLHPDGLISPTLSEGQR